MAQGRPKLCSPCEASLWKCHRVRSFTLHGTHLWYSTDVIPTFVLIQGYIYLLFTTFPGLFGSIYHENTGIIGLNYLGTGIGAVLGFISAFVGNAVYAR